MGTMIDIHHYGSCRISIINRSFARLLALSAPSGLGLLGTRECRHDENGKRCLQDLAAPSLSQCTLNPKP